MPDGAVKEGVSFQTTPLEIVKKISNSLAKEAVSSKVKYTSRVATLDAQVVDTDEHEQQVDDEAGWQFWDLERPLEGNCMMKILTFADPEGKMTFWHTSAHVLGAALERLYGVHLCYGPPTSDGFYYDSYIGKDKFTEADYKDIEKEADHISKEKFPMQRLVLTKEQALQMFAYNPFKVQLIQNKIADGGSATAYKCGPLIDLCTGPHISNTSLVKAFKVMKNSSAYWLGDKNNDSLQRIYAVSFPSAKELKEHIHFIEEAEKRDHRRLGTQQQLFFHHDYSPGSTFFNKEGSYIYNKLIELMRFQYTFRGFSEVITPNIFNLRLWKISGHYQKYKENMFMFKDECCGFGIKPMNCPAHHLIFLSQ